MIGLVLVTHGGLAEELIAAVRFVVGEKLPLRMEGVSLNPNQGFEDLAQRIRSAIEKIDEGDGVLLLTDMFGGTPSNIGLSFLGTHNAEVVTGVNLPMMVKLPMSLLRSRQTSK